MKTVFIVRGIPGSGKSTVTAHLGACSDRAVVSADDFFMVNGSYEFDPKKLPQAHDWCRAQFHKAIQDGVPVIIVDNTNIALDHLRPYQEVAREAGYLVCHVVMQVDDVDACVDRNTHGVPAHVIQRMLDGFEPSGLR